MKHKTKIEPHGTGFIGYAIVNEQIVYTSNVLRDPVAVSREIASFISSNVTPGIPARPIAPRANNPHPVPFTDNNLVPAKRTGPVQAQEEPQTNTFQPMPPPPRRCCGRG